MKTKIIIIIFLLFIFNYTNAKNNNNTFRIVVKESSSKMPIPFANIKITDINDNVNYTTTDDGGQAKFTISDDFKIEISCVGFKTVTEEMSYTNYKEIYLEEDFLNLDLVVVTGTQTKKSLKDSPILTQIVTAKDIEKVDAVNITSLLENEIPGLEFTQKGFGTSVSFQGLGAKYVLFLIDGVRIAGETGGNIDYSLINPDNIERIEVIKGAGALLYGSNAIGGVINIITKTPAKKWSAEASVRYAEMNKRDFSDTDIKNASFHHHKQVYRNLDLPNLNGNIAAAYKNKDFFTRTNFNYKTVDGYRFGDFSVNGQENYKVVQKIGFKLLNSNFVLNGSFYDHKEHDFKYVDNKSKNYNDIKYGIKSNFKIIDRINMVLDINTDKYTKNDYYIRLKQDSLNYVQTLNSAKAISTIDINSNNNLTVGFELLHERLENKMFIADKLIEHSANNKVLFIQDDLTLGKNFNIIAGFRLGHHSDYNTNFTPSISTKYTVNDFNFRATYTRGFVSPTLKELNMNWDHLGMFQIIGDKTLTPETSNSYTGSVEYTSPEQNINASATIYYTDIKNKIGGYWANNETEFRYANMDKSIAKGINILFKTKLGLGFTAKGSYAFTDNEDVFDGKNVSTQSPHNFTSQIDYKYTYKNYKLNVNISGKYRGIRKVNEAKYSDYSFWKLTINQNFGRHIRLTLGLNNLFNYKPPVYNFNSYTNPGRRYFVKVSYKL